MLNNVIAISGLAATGKDETAKMLEYLLNSPKIFHTYFWYNKLKNRFKKPYSITSFAKTMKESLAVMLGMNVEDFNNRFVKEHVFIDFNTLNRHTFVDVDPSTSEIPVMQDNKFAKALAHNDFSFVKDHLLTIRQIMQMFGTNMIRKTFGDKFWTLRTLTHNNIIISDLRFHIEMEELKKIDAITIYIERPGVYPGNHPSEREVLEMKNQYDYIIKNDGSLKDLFYKIKDVREKFFNSRS